MSRNICERRRESESFVQREKVECQNEHVPVLGTVKISVFYVIRFDENCSLSGQIFPLWASVPIIAFIYTELVASTLRSAYKIR